VTTASPAGGKRERTSARLLLCALALFESQGFEETTVAQIAETAGVAPMTFFRHFAAKAQVLLDDPYDPVIAASIARQPRRLRALARTTAGLRQAWAELPEPISEIQRRRVRVVATTPSLWGEMLASNARTEQLIVDQLVRDGTDRLTARAAAAATLAAVAAGLVEWSQQDDGSIGDAVTRALGVLDGADG
jgi:AcrR family transcriptional regulator